MALYSIDFSMLYKATVYDINISQIKLSANMVSYTIVLYNVDFQHCTNPDSYNISFQRCTNQWCTMQMLYDSSFSQHCTNQRCTMQHCTLHGLADSYNGFNVVRGTTVLLLSFILIVIVIHFSKSILFKKK